MKNIFVSIILLTFSSTTFALSVEKVLSSYRLESSSEDLGTSSSLFKEVSVRIGKENKTDDSSKTRTDLDDLAPAPDEFSDKDGKESSLDLSIRFSLNAIDNFQYKSELAKIQNQRLNKVKLEQQSLELSVLYKTYIKLHFGLQERDKLKKLLDTHEDAARVSKVLLKKGKLFITDVITAEKKITETLSLLRVKEEEVELTKKMLSKLTGLKVKERSMSTKNRFINVNKIVRLIKRSPKLSFSNLEVKKAQLDYKIEKAEANQILDFVEFSKTTSSGKDESINKTKNEQDNSRFFQEGLAFKVGFKIPFFTDKSRMHEKRINKMRKEHEAKMDNQASTEELGAIQSDIIGQVQELKSLLGSSYLKMTKKYLRIYKNSKGVSPFRLLQLRSVLTETEIKQAQLEKEIYSMYISFLATRGSLVRNQKTNVLSPSFRGEV